ncbi:unnamed protein product [Pieris brassicae]|uniref:Sulfatase N-terminal domain-containing protein n=1 Tax=Pieris brassicae TaxID=7116 RepID=A0A9P0TPK0_PIEBR|nr:unnamed protein product [Pieris brassicae]
MLVQTLFWQWWLILGVITVSANDVSPPHILFIVADDMGHNDVSYLGSDQISTPNLDALATRGVILKQYYSEASCTPARTALLTGKYPIRTGMQGFPLYNSEDRGIPLTEKLLPAHLKDIGYDTHLVGKWHLGMSSKAFLPQNRGYDSHYGMRGGFIDYLSYHKVEEWPNGTLMFGLDFFDNDIPQITEERYAVDALTDRAIEIIFGHNSSTPLFLHYSSCAPHAGNAGGALQPPLYKKLGSKHIANSNRRLYAEVVRHLDYSVGRLVRALADKGILQNTLIVFVSDNGSPTSGMFRNWGINLPFRGRKQTPWEGGVRVPAFIWHAGLKPNVWDGLMHISDWMPTLLAAAGRRFDEKIDGINQWPSILQGQQSPRKEVLVSVEDRDNGYAALRMGDYKLLIGNFTGIGSAYYGAEFLPNKEKPPDFYDSLASSEVAKMFSTLGITYDYGDVIATRKATLVKQIDTVTDQVPCIPTPNRGCLYNLKKDPAESHDLWLRGQKIVSLMTMRLRSFWSQMVRRGPTELNMDADPALHNYVWLTWLNNVTQESPLNEKEFYKYATPFNMGCECAKSWQNFLCIIRSVLQ